MAVPNMTVFVQKNSLSCLSEYKGLNVFMSSGSRMYSRSKWWKIYMSCLQLQVFFSSRMTAVHLKNSRKFPWSGSRLITSLIYYFKSPIIFYNSKLQPCNFELQKRICETERKQLRSYCNVETELIEAHLFIALITWMRTPNITNIACNSFMAL
jgi:hypothetical protein